jgi:hypothetical protein
MSLLNDLPTRERMETIKTLYYNKHILWEHHNEFPLLSAFLREIWSYEYGQLIPVSSELIAELPESASDIDYSQAFDEELTFSTDLEEAREEGIKRSGELMEDSTLIALFTHWENQLKEIFLRLTVRL